MALMSRYQAFFFILEMIYYKSIAKFIKDRCKTLHYIRLTGEVIMKKLYALLLAATLAIGSIFPAAQPVFAQENVRIQDDFYTATNTEWLSTTKIPEGYPSWGNFDSLNKKVSDDLRKIVEEYRKKIDLKENSDEKKLVDLYGSFLDYKSRDAQGITPIKGDLEKIQKASNLKELQNVMADLCKNGNENVISYLIDSDLKDNSKKVLYLDTGSLGMEDVDYYLKSDESTKAIQKAYKEYLTQLFVLKGDKKEIALQKADNVYNYEKALASVMLSREEARNFEKQYNVYTIEELEKLCPNLNWRDTFSVLGLEKAKKIVLGQPEYLKKLNSLLEEKNLELYKNYLEAIVLRDASSFLSRDFEKAAFEYSKVFSGVEKMRPDEERAFELVNASLGEILGKIYVEKYFSKEAKSDVESIVKGLINSYEKRINELDWMSKATKEKAIKKIETMNIKIGYPNKWKDYSFIKIASYKDGGSLLQNMKNINEYGRIKMLSDWEKPVDKDEWIMTPQTINAYYNPTINEIVFPAAILQDPFYKYGASRAANLGGIGMVIGHEISHAFDDQGSKFDENGNMINWWTNEDLKKFEEKTSKLAVQYSKYEVIPNVFLNGKFTLGENIADLGGMVSALETLEATENPNYDEFFRAFSKIWRSVDTDEISRYLVTVDPHSPGKFRVNGVLTNTDQFYKIYDVKSGDKMYTKPEDRVKIW